MNVSVFKTRREYFCAQLLHSSTLQHSYFQLSVLQRALCIDIQPEPSFRGYSMNRCRPCLTAPPCIAMYSMYENVNFVQNICPLREMGRLSDAHFAKSATILASSRNGQTQCRLHELANTLADFVKWAISQIGRNIYKTAVSTTSPLPRHRLYSLHSLLLLLYRHRQL